MIEAAAVGFGAGFSLILAIGAQNAFVLRQGAARAHVFTVCLICALSDAILIAVGVSGFGAAAEAAPWLEPLLRYGGAAFLIWYGWRSFRDAISAGGGALTAAERGAGSRRAAILTCLALTWLNPHVYLDTLALIGALASTWPPETRPAFGAGAIAASFTFFFALGYGARLLGPVLARPGAWSWLNAGIGAMMWAIAASLLI